MAYEAAWKTKPRHDQNTLVSEANQCSAHTSVFSTAYSYPSTQTTHNPASSSSGMFMVYPTTSSLLMKEELPNIFEEENKAKAGWKEPVVPPLKSASSFGVI